MSCITEAKFKERTTGDHLDLARRLGESPDLWNDDTRHDVSFFFISGRILGHNWDKSLKSFPPCYSQSSLLKDFTPERLC
jgi:hypothetical protein